MPQSQEEKAVAKPSQPNCSILRPEIASSLPPSSPQFCEAAWLCAFQPLCDNDIDGVALRMRGRNSTNRRYLWLAAELEHLHTSLLILETATKAKVCTRVLQIGVAFLPCVWNMSNRCRAMDV